MDGENPTSAAENAANALADSFMAAEAALADVTAKIRAAASVIRIGPLTRLSFVRRAQGIEGDLLELHLAVSPYDPRPQTRDGTGK